MDKKDLWQIGDVAKMFHVSVGTLRHYEKCGLLTPEYIDTETGYRYYSTRQFEVLSTIRSLRVLDMPLEQISDFLHNRDIDKMLEMLERQKDTVIRKQKKLKIIEKKIEHRIELLRDAVSSDIDTITVRRIPAIRVAWLRNTLSLHSYHDLETSLRQLEKDQEDTVVWLGKVGVAIAKEKLCAGIYDSYDMVFLILNQEDIYTGNTEIWPEETCVCLRFCGSHKEAPEYYQKLIDFITENHMCISGCSREITMIDNGMTNNPNQFVSELQIPVSIP